MSKSHLNIVIIGAGPAGLAVAGRLRKKDIPFEIFEQSPDVGSSWRNHYDRLHLHTVKKLSGLPHLPLPDHYPQYASRQQVVEYLEQYARQFEIEPHFNATITKLEKKKDDWQLDVKGSQPIHAQHVVIATGVNRIPNVPQWREQEMYNGKILHSRDYRNPNDTEGERVLVIGMGNTGAEIALDLSENNKQTFLSVRGPVSIIPRDIFGRPTQLTAQMLDKFPFGMGEWIGNQVRNLVVGDLSKYGIRKSRLSPAEQLKKTGKTPVLDIGTVKRIKAGNIQVIPEVSSFYEQGVITKDGVKVPVNTVILATGYQAGLNDLLVSTEGLLDQYGVPKEPIGKDQYDGLYFVGFDNYKLGGILGTIRTDSETIVEYLETQL